MKLKKYLVLILLLISCLLCSCSFKSKNNINQTLFVSIAGFDMEEDKIKITIFSKESKGGEESKDGQGFTYNIYYAYGRTVFEAYRNFDSYVNKDIFWGHLDYILIGEETARQGINKYLDLIIRDHETQINATLAVVKGFTASEFIEKTNKKELLLIDYLQNLFNDIGAVSMTDEISLLDYMMKMENEWTQGYLPCLSPADYSKKDEGNKDKKDIKLYGYCIFKEDKLVEITDDESARGISWLLGKIISGSIIVQDKEENMVSLEIIDSQTKIDVEMADKEPKAEIKITFTSNIVEHMGTESLINKENINYIIEKQNKVVRSEAEKALSVLKKNKTDIIGIGDMIYHRYPVKSQDLKEDWQNIFCDMEFKVNVQSRINRVYEINESISSKGDKSR